MSSFEGTAPIPVLPPAQRDGLSADTAAPRDRAVGVGLMLGSAASSQAGAAVGALAFPMIGVIGVVAIRQLMSALVLLSTVRPRIRPLDRAQWTRIAALTASFTTMNLGLYAAQERIGLGMAVTLEFLGPLAVAVFTSRRRIDIVCAVVAGIGVLVLTNPSPATDLIGIGLALLAAGAWAAYILLTRSLGQRLPGVQGTAIASGLNAVIWLPIALVWFSSHPLTLQAFALAAACGILATVIPAVSDLLALRRVPASLFGTFMSLSPVFAALAGWLILHQQLATNEWIGIALIVAANLVITTVTARSARTPQH